jgi:hypothetical protein
MDEARGHILQKYQVAPEAWLSSGMEAEVYAYGPDAVLKLYAGTASLADLLTLQGFYDGLDRQHVPYALPHIHTVAEEHGFLITISPSSSDWQGCGCLRCCPNARRASLIR